MGEATKKIREDLIYPELCYKIVGVLFGVYNKLGTGYLEKVYQKAVAEGLKLENLQFKEQLYSPVEYCGKIVGKFF